MFIDRVISHPNYQYTDGRRGYYDLAIVTLTSEITYQDLRIQPICIPDQASDAQDKWTDLYCQLVAVLDMSHHIVYIVTIVYTTSYIL